MWQALQELIAVVNVSQQQVRGFGHGRVTAPFPWDGNRRIGDAGLILTGTDAAMLAAERRALVEAWAPTIKASGFTMEQ